MEAAEALVSPMKVNELKENLKKRGLSTAGNKAILADRLKTAIAGENDGEDSEQPGAAAENVHSEGNGDEDQTEEQEQEQQSPEEPSYEQEKEAEGEQEAEEPKPTSELGDHQGERVEEENVENEVSEQEAMEEEKARQQEHENGAVAREDTTVEPKKDDQDTEAMEVDGGHSDKPSAETDSTASDILDVTDKEQDKDEKSQQESSDKEVCDVPTTTEKAESSEQEKMDEGKPEESSEPRGDRKREALPEDDQQQPEVSYEEKEAERRKERDEFVDPDEPTEMLEMTEDAFSTPPEDADTIILDRYNSDLHFNISADGLGGCGRTEGGFILLWAGCRANRGIKAGKYAFECRIEEKLEVDFDALNLEEEQECLHACRIGFSKDSVEFMLGEDSSSYAYGSTAKAVTNRSIVDYGETFDQGDVIGCYLDMDGELRSISFSKNGNSFGSAFVLSDDSAVDKGLFPHIATKNMRLSVNFGKEPFAHPLPEGYTAMQDADKEHLVKGQEPPSSKGECEVIMMVGLPCAGKSTWVDRQIRKNREKKFNVLGTTTILDRMKVSGIKKKDNYKERWHKLYKLACQMLEQQLVLASRSTRHFIIDQANLFKTSRTRKMGFFEGFKRKACLCVVSAEERRRRERRRDGFNPELTLDELKQMQINFTLPKEDEGFDEILFGELGMPDAERIIEAGHRWARGEVRKRPPFPGSGPPAFKRFRGSPEPWRSRGGGGGYYGNYSQPRGGFSPYNSGPGFGGYGGSPRGYGGGGYSPYGSYNSYGGPYGQYGGQRGNWRGRSPRGGRGGFGRR